MRAFFRICVIAASLLVSCSEWQHADLLIKNAQIQSVDSLMHTYTHMVVQDGRIAALGGAELEQVFQTDSVWDANGAFIYPGLHDAHAHFYGLGFTMLRLDLTGTKSWEDVILRCRNYVSQHHPTVLTARGWDQNDWENKNYPNHELLNRYFPDIPVLLKRVDGHAAIANNKALELANLHPGTHIEGGACLVRNNQLTGVLIDNAVDLVQDKLPKPGRAEQVTALLKAQENCLSNGLTSVCDAGLETDVILLIDSLQQAGLLNMRFDLMVSISDSNLDSWLKRGPILNEKLRVASFKMYADGALGSRGACLLQPYTDQPGHSGFLLTPPEKIKQYIKRVASSNWQLNTHCIGDSATRFLLHQIGNALGSGHTRRWRIEHAQVINPHDFHLFRHYGIVPSVQPTHATSDMYWAVERLGHERIKGAYALHTLLQQLGWLPLGTDFPVESVNPFYTFYAATERKDANGYPEKGFQPADALSRVETLRGMTIWAARASFEEQNRGSLETGKVADFVVMNEDLLHSDPQQIRSAKVMRVYIDGKREY